MTGPDAGRSAEIGHTAACHAAWCEPHDDGCTCGDAGMLHDLDEHAESAAEIVPPPAAASTPEEGQR